MTLSPFAATIAKAKYQHPGENWEDVGPRVVKHVMKALGLTLRDRVSKLLAQAIVDRKFMPGGRYLYAAGRPFHQVQNCLLLRAYDSREGWSELMQKASMALMTGAGIGVDYSGIRPEGSPIRKTGGEATGPTALMQMVNEAGRFIMQGGARRSAIWAGLNWRHTDAHKFIHMKNWIPEVRALKEKNYSFPAPLDQTNISVQLDDDFFAAYRNPKHNDHGLATSIYRAVVRLMLETGEPGFSIDVGPNANDTLRNACTEVCSADSDDICNLGSINMGAIDTLSEFEELVEAATLFLLAGSVYSDVPYADVDRVRTKNRRLGLGLMGVHEWLIKRGKPYAPDDELWRWLVVYKNGTDAAARKWALEHKLSVPKATRAIAPNGTIGIVAETTGGLEPVFCVAYKRRYLRGGSHWVAQYVVDPVAKRLITQGVNPGTIEDAYRLAEDVERRVVFQAWLQQVVDHGISSTINLPRWGSSVNNEDRVLWFGDMLMRHLPNLRGVTCYPDGARGGQPLVPVAYEEAVGQEGVEIVEASTDVCSIVGKGVCGE